LDDAHSLQHATCIAIDGDGVLFVGPSGSGKSDLALRCIMQPPIVRGRRPEAVLVADDQVILERRENSIFCRPPGTISGRIEVRGLGIIDMPFATSARLRIVVKFEDKADIPRMPDPPSTTQLLGVAVPVVKVAPFEASAPLKVYLALEQTVR